MKYKCLENLIGIKTDCEDIKGFSSYTVNRIPGIDMPMSNAIANQREYKTGLDVIKNNLEFAYDIVGDDVLKALKNSYKIVPILDQVSFCFYKGAFKDLYAGNRGVRIKRKYMNDYTMLKIPFVTIQIQQDATITLTIKESNGKVTDFDDITLKARTPMDVQVEFETSCEYIDIYIDNTDVNVAETACSTGCANCNRLTHHRYNDFLECFGYVDGELNTEETFGIIPSCQTICSQTKLLCNVKSEIDLLVLYKFAGLFFAEAVMSKRNNRYTTFTRPESEAQSFYYDNPVQQNGLYQVELAKVTESLSAYFGSFNNICFECTDSHYGFARP